MAHKPNRFVHVSGLFWDVAVGHFGQIENLSFWYRPLQIKVRQKRTKSKGDERCAVGYGRGQSWSCCTIDLLAHRTVPNALFTALCMADRSVTNATSEVSNSSSCGL